MLATDRVLGPRWSQKELRTFYILLKAYGRQWERIEERLPSRSQAMIRALYDMHRGYLSLPEASAEGFCTIMTDHYKSLDELQRAGGVGLAPASEQSGARLVQLAAATMEATHAASPAPPSLAVTPQPLEKEETVPAPADMRSKKKRKLELLLARDEPRQSHEQPVKRQDRDDSTGPGRKRPRKPAAVARRRRDLRGESDPRCFARKFELPWFYWFVSYIDADFFAHNEFVECLQGMQLGSLFKAARPIWSSVRASMGHPRRLSVRFLTEEKQKLEAYRTVKRSGETPISNRWPYKTPTPLAAGARVVANLSYPKRFVTGTLENFSVRDGVCRVRLDNQGGRVCSLDSIMILRDDRDPASSIDSLSLSDVREERVASSALLEMEESRQDKLATVALVRDLLKRKELIIDALAKMNAQARILRHDVSSTTYVAANTPGDETVFQRQYAWLVVNLDVTNRYLRAALLRLQDVSEFPKAAASGVLTACASAASHTSVRDASVGEEGPTTLTLEHMRWAVNFLTTSRKKSAELVSDLTAIEAKASGQQAALSPDIDELIANCLSIASVIRRGSSADIPPLITQKLMERMFELLEPRFESNMDLYAELRSAAEGLTVIQRQMSADVDPE